MKPTKKTAAKATEPSADASPAHKNRIAAARKNRGAPPIEESPAAAPETTTPIAETEPTSGEAAAPIPETNAPEVALTRRRNLRGSSFLVAGRAAARARAEAAAANAATTAAAVDQLTTEIEQIARETGAANDAPFATLKDLGATWIEYLKANGATTSTWSGYARDLDLACDVLGADTHPGLIGPEAIASFEACDAVTKKKSGAPRAMPTILKTRRVLRLALTWAHGSGRLATLPYAKKAGAA